MTSLRRSSTVVALFFALIGLITSPVLMTAQDTATPTMGATHPAHIHNGTCDTLGDVVYPLNDVALAPEGGTPVASPDMMEAMHDEVLTSVTTVEVSLPELLAGEFAINVHASPDDMGTFIACGEITGTMRLHRQSEAPAGLVIPLRELNDSGYAGIAWLAPTDDGQTEVTLFLVTGLFGPGPRA